MRAGIVAAFLVFAAGGTAAYAQYDVTAGYDYWQTISEGTHVDFAPPAGPIPAGFFGPGSDPFDGVIHLEGGTIDPPPALDYSTIVERIDDAILPDPYTSSATINIQMVELSLVSTEPIRVTYYGGTGIDSFFDVYVTLNPGTTPAAR